MGFNTPDNCDNVLENRRRFLKLFKINPTDTVSALQVHGSLINVADSGNCGEGSLPGNVKLKCDALVTTTPALVLNAYSADCLLIYFAVPGVPLVAIAHAGRQGTYENLASKVVTFISKNFGISPAEILVSLSPLICKTCYTIDENTARAFLAAGWNDERYLKQVRQEKWELDLQSINISQLRQTGIERKNIEVSGYCTACREDLFYSYRRDLGVTGRMLGFIMIEA